MTRRVPDAYTPELHERKCASVYQHVYDCYYGEGRCLYGLAA